MLFRISNIFIVLLIHTTVSKDQQNLQGGGTHQRQNEKNIVVDMYLPLSQKINVTTTTF